MTTPRWGNECRERKAEAIVGALLAAAPDVPMNGRWLDIGCGSGGIAAKISEAVDSVVAVDPEPWVEWSAKKSTHPNLSFVEAHFDSHDLPSLEGSFDVVVCNQVYEHTENPAQLICNIGKILRPGGYCYFAGPNLIWPIEPHIFLPFVHWLPRPFSMRLLRFFGVKRAEQFDAFSTTHWRLTRWFSEAGLEWRCILRHRISASLSAKGSQWAVKALRFLPNFVFDLVHPYSPGFVFLLSKRETSRAETA